ncbi:MAG: alpha-galactosidase [Spirochaetales bacterium]
MIELNGTVESGITLHLRSGATSYICESDGGVLVHRYWGPALPADAPRGDERALFDDARPLAYSVERQTVDELLARPDVDDRRRRILGEDSAGFSEPENPAVSGVPHPESVMSLRREYPDALGGDTRVAAIELRFADGSRSANLKLESACVYSGMPVIEGLPALRSESGGHVRLTLVDERVQVRVHLFYALPDEHSGVIARHVEVENTADVAVELISIASMSVDLPAGDREVLHLAGAWGRERSPKRVPLRASRVSISSRRGASGHEHAPFMAVCDRGVGETHGRAYAATLVYSGNHRFVAEEDSHGVTRFLCGINPEGFSRRLAPGERFASPQAVMLHSQTGLTALSHSFHFCARNFLIPERYRGYRPPIVLNSWEALYFQVDDYSVRSLAPHAKEIGAEVLVVDDGWFEGRDDDRSSLGDWFTHAGKFPDGLDATRAALIDHGLALGIWMEPEMVSPASRLYNDHPDWCLHDRGVSRMTSRNQLPLDLSRDEVQDWIIEQVSRVVTESGASYLKWDMNRPFSSEGSSSLPAERQGEVAHRYVLGLYRILGELAARHPDLLIEGCAGGGGRFDWGMLSYLPQYWTSDDTDAAERIRIQGGSSFFLPPESMGAHVSVVPNHQVGRVTPAHSRVAAALFGAFGFELDPRSVSLEERELFSAASERYTRVRQWLSDSSFYRLTDVGDERYAGFAAVSADRRHALVLAGTLRAVPDPPVVRLPVPGLLPDAVYRDRDRGLRLRGALLGASGLAAPRDRGDWVFDLYELDCE